MVFKKSFLLRVTYRTLHFSKWKAIFHFSYDTASLSRCCCKRHNLFIYFTARYAMLSYAKSRMMETLADLFHRGLVYDIRFRQIKPIILLAFVHILFVQFHVFTFSVPCFDVRYSVRLKQYSIGFYCLLFCMGCKLYLCYLYLIDLLWFDLWCFSATFSNISAISWRWVLVVEEAGVPRDITIYAG